MSSNLFTQHYADGSKRVLRRATKQGRKPSGLADPQLIRLYKADKDRLAKHANELSYLYNENEIIREAVRMYLDKLDNSVYTELVKS